MDKISINHDVKKIILILKVLIRYRAIVLY